MRDKNDRISELYNSMYEEDAERYRSKNKCEKSKIVGEIEL